MNNEKAEVYGIETSAFTRHDQGNFAFFKWRQSTKIQNAACNCLILPYDGG